MSNWFLLVGAALMIVILFVWAVGWIVDWLARTKVSGGAMALFGVLVASSLVLAGVLAKVMGQ